MNNNITIINGPNLNLLGEREQSQYGSITFDDLKKICLEQAKKLNCEKVDNGHYAKIVNNGGELELHKADYLNKDQSYVLHMLTKDKLKFNSLAFSKQFFFS